MNHLFTFPKAERLLHRKQIDKLFNEGLSFNLNPFKVYYILEPTDAEMPVKVLITASRKKFKRAVDRNRLRRMTREAYRLHKSLLLEKAATVPGSLHIGFVYVGTQKDMAYADLEKQVIRCLERLGGILNNSSDRSSGSGRP